MMVLGEGGKPDNPGKNPWREARTNNKLKSHIAPGRNRTHATLVGGEGSHHCTNPAPRPKELWEELSLPCRRLIGAS